MLMQVLGDTTAEQLTTKMPLYDCMLLLKPHVQREATRNFVFDSLITNLTLENENENCLVGKFIFHEKYFMFQQTEPKSKVSLVNWGDLSFLLIITQRDLPIMFVLLLAQLGDPKHLIG